MKSVWKCKVVEKGTDIYVIRGVRWYDVVDLRSKYWSGGEE